MRVLIGMEESQVICTAFREAGHEAFSCDLKPSSGGHPEWHLQGDVMKYLDDNWDIIIMHPECTKIAVCGNRTYNETEERKEAIEYTENLWKKCISICRAVCFENPVGVLTTQSILPKPQYIQPYEFGHMETKKTALFLHGLPFLISTHNVFAQMQKLPNKLKHRIWYGTGMKDRRTERSKSYLGIAKAMASQWGDVKNHRPAPLILF